MNLVLSIAPLIVIATATAQQHDQQYMNPVVASQQNDVMASVPPSPECWMDAMKAMHQLERDAAATHHTTQEPLSLGSMVCTNMLHDHKKALALELARCQMKDVGRSLFVDTNKVDCSRPVKSTTLLHSCLSLMTDQGMHSYALFFTHVHQSCTRLTQEQLVQASQVATEQLHSMLAHQSKMWAERDEELRAQHEEMLETLWIKAEEREKEMLELTKNVEATAEKMKPLLGIESLVSMATNGITWLTSLIHFLGIMNAVWLLTLSKRHDYTRRFMFRIACIEALLEFAMHWMVTQGLLADSERVRGIGVLRSWTLTLECCAYVVGLILSVFWRPRRQEDSMNEQMVEVMQLLAANAGQIQKEETPPQREQPQRVIEVVIPRVQQPVHPQVAEDANDPNDGSSTIMLPPMYKELGRPNVSLGSAVPNTITPTAMESMEQTYAAAYYEALRVLSQQQQQQQASMGAVQQNAMIPHVLQDSPSQISVQVIDERENGEESKDPKKRLLDEDEDGEKMQEPDRKRARTEQSA